MSKELSKQNPLGLKTYDLGEGILPDLNDAEALDFNIISNYWKPTVQGEYKRVFFQEVKMDTILDDQTQKEKELPHAYFIEQDEEGNKSVMKNASWKLVEAFKNIPTGSAWQIVYKGKQDDGRSSNWLIQPLTFRSEAYEETPDLEGVEEF